MDKVAGPIYVVGVLQAAVVDAGICQAPRQVGTCQGLVGHLWDGHLVAEFAHMLTEKVCIADVKGGQRGVEGCHCDGGDLGTYYMEAEEITLSYCGERERKKSDKRL